MKVKINRRLLQIGILTLIVAIIVTVLVFNQMKKAAQPEPTESIAYFADYLPVGIILKDSDIKMKETPKSMIPVDAVRHKRELVGREIVANVSKDDFALINKTTERGEVKKDVQDLWEIGIEVKEISDFLGSQIKVDEYYALLFADPLINQKYPINKVKVTGLVDSTGRIIHQNSDSLPKTVLLTVGTEEEMKEIASYKIKGLFELVRPPKDWEFVKEEIDFKDLEGIVEIPSTQLGEEGEADNM